MIYSYLHLANLYGKYVWYVWDAAKLQVDSNHKKHLSNAYKMCSVQEH